MIRFQPRRGAAGDFGFAEFLVCVGERDGEGVDSGAGAAG